MSRSGRGRRARPVLIATTLLLVSVLIAFGAVKLTRGSPERVKSAGPSAAGAAEPPRTSTTRAPTTTTEPVASDVDIAFSTIDGYFSGTGDMEDCSNGIEWTAEFCAPENASQPTWFTVECTGDQCTLALWDLYDIPLAMAEDLAWTGEARLTGLWACNGKDDVVEASVQLRSTSASWNRDRFESDRLAGRIHFSGTGDGGCSIGFQHWSVEVDRM